MRKLLLPLVLVLVACGGESSLPPGDAGVDTPLADAPTTGRYAGHPLVGTWEAPETDPRSVGALRRTFSAEGSMTVYGYYNDRNAPGCLAATRGTDGTWMPAGDGAFSGSMMTLTLSRDCGSMSTPVRTSRSNELAGRHTFTIIGGELRFDPEAGPGYVFRRVQP